MVEKATEGDSPTAAVVLAAGEGTRLRPLTSNRPKPMLPVATRSVLKYVLDSVIDAGIDELHLIVGYRSSRVKSHIGSSYRDITIEYHQQESQLGSGHALLQARDTIDAPFIVVNGDQIVDTEMVREVRAAYQAPATIAVVEADRAPQYGAVRLDGNQVSEIIERPQTGNYRLLNAGVYAFAPAVFDRLEELERVDGTLPLPAVIADYVDSDVPVTTVRSDWFWRDATYPWDLLALSQELQTRGLVTLPEIRSNVFVSDSSQVHDQAILISPVVVDDDAVVEAGAVVGPHAALGANSNVEAGAVVRNSIIDEGTRVGANATVGQLVTGQDVQIGAGTTVAAGPADVQQGSTVHENVELGAVLADRVHLGEGATTLGGTQVGTDAVIGAGVVLDDAVDAKTRVIR